MVQRLRKRRTTMKIIIRVVNGLSLGLYLQDYEPIPWLVEYEEEMGYTMAGFSGLCIHLGFVQIQMGKVEVPKE